MQKYGFIYIWYDRKYRRFYLGRHWGRVDDGYICSSNSMRDAYRRRPEDFKRRIISYVQTSVNDLVIEEQKWLNKIKIVECGKKYYNVSLSASTPTMRNKKHSDETKEKMKSAALGRLVSEETKEKLRQVNLGKKYSSEVNSKKGINNRDYSDPIFLEKMSLAAKSRSMETRKKISENNKRLQLEGKIGMKGKKHSEETKAKMREAAIKRNLNNSINITKSPSKE
jgi:hypothetical protein